MTRLDEMLALADCIDSVTLYGRNYPLTSYEAKMAVTALRSAAQAEPGYVVKPLKWRTHKGDDFCDVHYDSDAIGGSYTIEARKNGSFDLWKPNVQAGRYASLDEAKSAAQRDYEQRIRSAIVATVGTAEPGYVAGFEACAHDYILMPVGQDGRPLHGVTAARQMSFPAGRFCQHCLQPEGPHAALPAPATASAGWQPIETAPKDGTEIIGIYYRPADGMLKETSYGPWTIAFERGQWRSSWDRSEVVEYMSDFGTEYKEPDCEPTHWMPLPAVPTKRSAT